MIKRSSKLLSLLVALMLLVQLAIPMGRVAASTDSTMLPPSNLTTNLLAPENVRLTWSAVTGATGYNIYEISEGQLRMLGTVANTTYQASNLPEGSYSYAVSTLSETGESGPSAPVAVDIVYPDMQAPESLTNTLPNGNDIALRWTASAYAGSYNLYKIAEDGQQVLIYSGTGRSYTITNASEGIYKYAVSAANALYGESPISSPIEIQVVYPVMTAPNNLSFTVTNGSDVDLNWSAVSYATAYRIYQIVDGEPSLRSTVTGTSSKLSNMPAGDYIYEVRSYSERFGESAGGSQLSVTVGTVTMTAPTNYTFKLQNINDIVLSWDAVANATQYNVYEVINGEKVLKSTITKTTITYAKMAPGDYVYTVHAYSDRFGESAEGSQVSLTIEQVTMDKPSSAAYELKNGNDIYLSWESVANADDYKIYQIVDGQKVLKRTVSPTTAAFANMPAGDYTYEVHANSARFGESVEGTRVSVAVIFPIMQAPENVTQTIKSATSFSLSWTAAEYAASYKVYQIIDGEKVLKSTITGTTVTYSNVQPGEYSYEVHSFSARFGESSNGSSVTVTMNGQTMETPSGLTQSINNGNDIALKWTAVPYAASYKIYQLIDGEKVLKSTVTKTNVTYTNLPSGDYHYVVHSFSTLLGESPEGAEAIIALIHPTMEAPVNFASKVQNGNDVVLTWTAVPYANNYKVYEIVDGQPVLKNTVTALSVTIAKVPVGEHTYVVHSVSTRFGESLEGSSLSLTVQEQLMQPPTNLTQTLSNGNDITLKWTAANYATDYKIYEIIGRERVLQKTVTGTSSVFANMGEGEHTFQVYSYSDRFGDSTEGSDVSFTIIFPTMQAPVNFTNSIANGNDIVLRWDASAYATSYNVYQIVEGQKSLVKTVTGRSVTQTNMPESDYVYEVHSVSNRFGESPNASKVEFALVWPVVQAPTLTAAVFNANNIMLSWKGVTWANEYHVYAVKNGERQLIYTGKGLTTNVYNMTEDIHSYEMTAFSSRFGESVTSNRITENIIYPEMLPPIASLKVLTPTSAQISWDFITYANGYNIYEIINGEPVLLVQNVNNLSYTVSDLSYANHEYVVTSYSNSFGESSNSNTVLAKLIVDTEAPVTTANAPTSWMNQSTVVVLTATDNETGVANTYYSLNNGDYVNGASLNVTEEGVNHISFYSVDKVGNIEVAQTIDIKIDKIAPITEVSPIHGWLRESVTVNLNAYDTQSGTAKTFYSINGTDYAEGASFNVDKEGINQVSFYSVDEAGNVEEAKTVEVKIDRTAPVTTSDASEGWFKEPVTVNLHTEDTQSGANKTFYAINGSEYEEGISFNVDEEGINNISFYSVDQAGNVEEVKMVEVKIDRTAPITTTDASTAWSKEEVTVKLSAADTLSGVVQTLYAVNGSDYTEGTAVKVNEEGIHRITFYSVDIAGNIEITNTIEVKIDKTAPAIAMDMQAEYKLGTVLPLVYTATDELSGIVFEQMVIIGPDSAAGTIAANGSSMTLNKPGDYNVTVTVTDAAGLITTIQKQITVYIEATMEVLPHVIKGNKGVFTVQVNLPDWLNGSGIVLDTATVNGVQALNDNKGYYMMAKLGHFKFERSDFDWKTSEVTLEFRGYVNGNLVVAQKKVKVQTDLTGIKGGYKDDDRDDHDSDNDDREDDNRKKDRSAVISPSRR